MTALLPVLKIKTNHSEYLIDQNKGTFTRTRQYEHASELSGWGIPDAGEEKEYADISLSLEPGGHLIITFENGTFLISTGIVSVEELSPEVAE